MAYYKGKRCSDYSYHAFSFFRICFWEYGRRAFNAGVWLYRIGLFSRPCLGIWKLAKGYAMLKESERKRYFVFHNIHYRSYAITRKAKRIFQVTFILGVVFSQIAFSQSNNNTYDDSYSLSNIVTSAAGEDAAHARARALRFAKLKTLREVIRRIVPYDAFSSVKTPDDKLIDVLVPNLTVKAEEPGNAFYAAIMSARADKEALHKYLHNDGIAFARLNTVPIAALAFYIDEDKKHYLGAESENLFHDVWMKKSRPTGVLRFNFFKPQTPELLDKEFYNAAFSQDKLSKLLTASGQSSLLLLIAQMQPNKIILNAYAAGALHGPKQFNQELNRNESESDQALLERGLERIMLAYEEPWKAANIVIPAPSSAIKTQSLDLVALTPNDALWKTLKLRAESLQNIERISKMRTVENGVAAKLIFYGDVPRLVQDLQRKGVSIFQNNGRIYLQLQ